MVEGGKGGCVTVESFLRHPAGFCAITSASDTSYHFGISLLRLRAAPLGCSGMSMYT